MSENENLEQVTPAVEAPAKEPAKPLPSPFYEDGYTRTVVIPSELTGFAPVKLVYRPIVADEDSKFWAWLRINDKLPVMDYWAPLLAKDKLIDWNIKSQAGNRVPVSEANLRRLAPEFHEVLLNVVKGAEKLPDVNGNPGPTLKN